MKIAAVWISMWLAGQQQMPPESGERLFREWNRNGDDVLSRQEWRGPGAAFLRYDQNRDAYLSLAELTVGPTTETTVAAGPAADQVQIAIGEFWGEEPEWFRRSCNRCHSSDRIVEAEKNSEEWQTTVEVMREKEGAGLSAGEAQKALRYLLEQRRRVVTEALRLGTLEAEREWARILQDPSLDRFDRDRNGKLSGKELMQLLMNRLDFDGDGRLSLAEYCLMPVARDRVAEFHREDRNEDGAVSIRELGIPESLIQVADVDRDGALAIPEVPRLIPVGPMRLPMQDAETMMATLDRNRDRQLSQRELQLERPVMLLADQDRNNALDEDELKRLTGIAQARGIPVAFPSVITRYDLDRDGTVSIAEFPGPDFVFQRCDHNGNGILDWHDTVANVVIPEFDDQALRWRGWP